MIFERDGAWILLTALLLEWIFGDPKTAWHPVAVFGRWASWVEAYVWRNRRILGVLAWFVVVLLPFLLLVGLLYWCDLLKQAEWWGQVWSNDGWECAFIFLQAALLWATLGWKSLLEHVSKVADAQDVLQAREQVGQIVGRQTCAMDEQDIRRASIETLAENTSDSIVAPLFYFALFGVLGACFYRMINTLDAMWGYRNQRYQAFGWWAAKLDDVANWIPARLTALLMLIQQPCCLQVQMYAQAKAHLSPNAGFPETSMAFLLGIRLGGPVQRAEYMEDRAWMGLQTRLIQRQDIQQAKVVTNIAVVLMLCCLMLLWGLS